MRLLERFLLRRERFPPRDSYNEVLPLSEAGRIAGVFNIVDIIQYRNIFIQVLFMPTYCVAFVCNFRYLDKFFETCNALIYVGEYSGPIVLLVGNDINIRALNALPFFTKHPQILIRQEPDIVFSDQATKTIHSTNAKCDKFGYKLFQYHKFYLFTPYFKQWDHVLYVDCGTKIYDSIAPILACAVPGTLVAHSDAYPTYKWKLKDQFVESIDYNRDYFQTTIMLYSTEIIEKDVRQPLKTFNTLCSLTEQHPDCKTNDQGIINLAFIDHWTQMPLGDEKNHYYDFCVRHSNKSYIMTKYYVFND